MAVNGFFCTAKAQIFFIYRPEKQMICGRLFNVWVNLLLALFLYGYSNKDSKRDAIITSKNIKYIYVFFGVSCGYEGGNHSRKCTICRYFFIHETSKMWSCLNKISRTLFLWFLKSSNHIKGLISIYKSLADYVQFLQSSLWILRCFR